MYSHLVLGGTFDHFHAGHENFLRTAFSLSGHVLLGLTLPEMNKGKSFPEIILPYEERKKEIETFVRSLHRLTDLEIIPIGDVYGTTLENKKLEAILVTPHSLSGAEQINLARKQKSLPSLEINVCELLSDQTGEVLCSTRIREGLVNRSGFVYSLLFSHTLNISSSIKEYVRQPLGESHFTFPVEWPQILLIFVGDIVTQTAIKLKLSFASAWIDGRSSREQFDFSVPKPYLFSDTNLINDPGTINSEIASFMEEHLNGQKEVFKVGGEEDLLTLPAILLSPLGSVVTYGNPHGQKDVTVVTVTEEKKEEIRELLESIQR